MTKPLSPAAQAVLDAWAASENGVYLLDDPERLAAALRAAVEQVLPDESRPTPGSVQPGGTRMYFHERMARWEERQDARRELLAIAQELEYTNA